MMTNYSRIAFLSPINIDGNEYIDLQKKILSEAGCTVKGLTSEIIRDGTWRELFCRDNLVIVHWLENRLFNNYGGKTRVSVVGALVLLLFASVLAVTRAKVVYFIHNHAVHDSSGCARFVSKQVIRWIGQIADLRIVHDPASREMFKAEYLPHPLYWNSRDVSYVERSVPPEASPLFVIAGAIRPYKKIDEVLEAWPEGARLLIAGSGDRQYVQGLQTIVERRKLGDRVDIENKFLSATELAALIGRAGVFLLPHAATSMLVSGAFFEAYGRVPAIIARETPFTRWLAMWASSVFVVRDMTELPAVVENVRQEWQHLRCRTPTAAAIESFGWERCVRSYRDMLLSGRSPTASHSDST